MLDRYLAAVLAMSLIPFAPFRCQRFPFSPQLLTWLVFAESIRYADPKINEGDFMADESEEIVVKGKIKGKDFEIKLKKGKKGKKHRKKDKVKINLDGNDITGFIEEGADEDGVDVEWITAEENNIGGWTGVAGGFSLRVHCPPKDGAKPGDEPYVNVEIPEKARDKWKKFGKGLGLPDPPDGEIKVPITKEQQTALNDYFKDPDLPKKLF